jgi:hypothetical protein
MTKLIAVGCGSSPLDGFQPRPSNPAEVLPRSPIGVALGMQDLRTRVFRSVELKDHHFGYGTPGSEAASRSRVSSSES